MSGESPVVDVQSAQREAVVDGDVIATLPGTRSTGSLLTMIPGIDTFGAALAASPGLVTFYARGGNVLEGRFNVGGMPVANAFAGGGGSSLVYDIVNVDEVTFNIGGGLGESDIGGPVLNIVPRSGGNTFRGQAFINFSNDQMRGNNLTPELMAPSPGPNLQAAPGIINAYDTNISYGGPIVRDRLWFYASYRRLDTQTAAPGIVANANQFDLSKWTWLPDETVTGRLPTRRTIYIGRLTSQVAAQHRVSVNWEAQRRCDGAPIKLESDGCRDRGSSWQPVAGGPGNSNTSPEAAMNYLEAPYTIVQGRWTNPLTNRLLLEAGATYYSYEHAGGFLARPPDAIFDIGVTEQSTAINPATGAPWAPRANYIYRAMSEYREDTASPNNWNASAQYVTGTHSLKSGYQGAYQAASTIRRANPTLLSYNLLRAYPPDLHRAHPRLGGSQPDMDAVALRAGHLDPRPADAAGRTAIRPGVELCSRRPQRDEYPRAAAGARCDHVPEDSQRRCVQRHHAAGRGGVRCVRQREDSGQVQHGALSYGGD